MPWQSGVLDTALEVDPETGLLVYREVVLTVPRQSGKTWLLLCLMVHRALGFGEPQMVLYTAQNRIEARKKWEDDFVRRLERSGLRYQFTVRRQIGQEAIRWNNGSLQGITSATEKSGHGSTLDLAVLDEAFAHEDARLEQALKPTMVTRPEPQMWIVSTAGTRKSVFLRGKVDAGRAHALSGVTEGSFYGEYSAPEGVDPADPVTWRACMPALGHTVDESVIRADFLSMDEVEFRRAYLNQWPDQMPGAWAVIPQKLWTVRGGAVGPPDGPVGFAVSATWPNADRSWIAVAGRRNGEMVVQLVSVEEGGKQVVGVGTSWIPARLRQLQDKWRPVATVLDDKDPAAREKAAIERAGVDLTRVNATEAGQAAGMFLAAVCGDAPYLRHFGQPELDNAVAGATKRPLGDAWTWARQGPVDISPLVAATFAVHGVASHESAPFFSAWR